MQLRFFRHQSLLALSLSLGFGVAQAATPATGVLSPTSGPITYASGPFTSANVTPVPLLDTGPTCGSPGPACDSYELTVSLPAGYAAAHNADSLRISTGWTDAGAGFSDYDLYVYKGAIGATGGSDTPPYTSVSGNNPEATTIFPLLDGDNVYTIKIVPTTPTGETLTTTIELVSAVSQVFDPNFGNPETAKPGVARFQIYEPFGLTAEANSGECNIGFNPLTFKVMFMCFGNGSVYRITTPERLAEPLPEACNAVWEDVTPAATSQAQPVADPILFTDHISGRTWASNLTAGPNVSYAYTDNDGSSWINAGIAGVVGADHQTIGSGPYPASFALPHPLHENAVYFCSQDAVGPAGCARSDDGGMSYGITTLAYDGSLCTGLHGHVRVAPDGTAWLPVAECGTGTGYTVSTDAGMTWKDAQLPGSLGSVGSDPTISLDDDNTAYFCYADGDGHMRAATSRDRGVTWTDFTDLGIGHGVKNSAFPQSWAGSSGRAACGFMGTDREGNLESLDFPGLWYQYVAHTYDGGKTWTTIIITPNDPVQGVGGVWQSGGSNPNRNLLDFNEATADEKGRFIFGYDDGCVRDCAKAPRANPQSFTAMMTMARQTGGKGLRAELDVPEPHAPANACLAGKRGKARSILTWREPDHGGAAIANYKVFRSTSASGPFTFVGDAGPKASYVDGSVDPNVETYFYNITAVNSAGEGVASNLVSLPVVEEIIETACVLPGITQFVDPTGDATAPVPGHDLLLTAIAEPANMDGKLVITMKVDDLSTPPPNSRWVTYFTTPDGVNRYAAMVTSQGLPTFEYGTSGLAPAVGTARVFTPEGQPDEGSGFSADGIITLILDKATIGGLKTGDVLSDITTSIRSTSPGTGAGVSVDTAITVAYTLLGNVCAAGGPGLPPVVAPGAGGVASQGRFGGAFGLLTLLPLIFVGLRRRRR